MALLGSLRYLGVKTQFHKKQTMPSSFPSLPWCEKTGFTEANKANGGSAPHSFGA